jgi:hypothetical protein
LAIGYWLSAIAKRISALIQAFSGLAICWHIFQSRASSSVWAGFVFGFSHPTSTAGSGSQKADETTVAEVFMATSLVTGVLGPNNWINDVPSPYKGKERTGFQEICVIKDDSSAICVGPAVRVGCTLLSLSFETADHPGSSSADDHRRDYPRERPGHIAENQGHKSATLFALPGELVTRRFRSGPSPLPLARLLIGILKEPGKPRRP